MNTPKLSKTAWTWIIIGVVALLLFVWIKSAYNGLVRTDETVTAQWANVESQYQRRADLVPNLVATVKGYAAHEQETFTAVTEARAKATQTVVDLSDPQSVERFNAAQGQLTSSLSRLLLVAENYPDLKANQNFLDLQTQLEGTENRIATERMRYNEAVRQYNVYVRQFPRNIIAGMFGFTTKTPFAAAEGADVAPSVSFE